MTGDTIEVTAVEVLDVRSDRLDAARKLISSAAKWSMAASLIPVPYLDMATLATLQTRLILNLAALYNQRLPKEAVSGVISVLIGTLAPAGASHVATSVLVKFMPGVGSLIGAASLAAFSSAATYAVGNVFVRHFESGGSYASFSPKDVHADLKKEFASAPGI